MQREAVEQLPTIRTAKGGAVKRTRLAVGPSLQNTANGTPLTVPPAAWFMRLLAIASVLTIAAAPAAAQMRGTVERVGLTGGGQHAIREGCWTCVDVQLTNDSPATFDGSLRVEQFDRDRDVVVATLRDVAVQGGQTRPYRVYFMPSSLRPQDAVRVRLFDANNNLVKLQDAGGKAHDFIESNPVDVISQGGTVVVDLSGSRLAQQVLASRVPGSDPDEKRDVRGLAVEPRALPDRWQGLEFADAVVWDDADASAVEPDQLKALADWVRHGGRLLITCSRTWQSIADSKLAAVLPVRLGGVGQITRREAFALLPDFWTGSDTNAVPDGKAAVTRCLTQPLALGSACEPLGGEANKALVFRRRIGRGQVVFVGAALRELFTPLVSRKALRAHSADVPDDGRSAPPDPLMSEANLRAMQRLFRDLLAIPEPPKGGLKLAPTGMDPYEAVTRRISFQQRGALYLLLSFLFAAFYVLTATWGTWMWLGRRNWRHHAWTAFTAVGICGALIGFAAVSALHGFTRRVHDVQVVDAWANLPDAQASCLFGLRTPRDSNLALRLPITEAGEDAPDAGGPICTLPPLTGMGHEVTGYIAPATYTAEQNGRQLKDVRVRATLKEFAGLWEGQLDGNGHLDAKLVAHTRKVSGTNVDYFDKGSFLRNNLSVDLRGCIVLDTQRDFVRRANDVRCFLVGDLKKGEERADFAAWFIKGKADPADVAAGSSQGGEAFLTAGAIPRLGNWIGNWTRDASSLFKTGADANPTRDALQSTDMALLLLATFDAYHPEDHDSNLPAVERSGGRRFGCLQQLDRRHALLIGFADTAGPARLEVNRVSLSGSYSLTMYRFVVPVERP